MAVARGSICRTSFGSVSSRRFQRAHLRRVWWSTELAQGNQARINVFPKIAESPASRTTQNTGLLLEVDLVAFISQLDHSLLRSAGAITDRRRTLLDFQEGESIESFITPSRPDDPNPIKAGIQRDAWRLQWNNSKAATAQCRPPPSKQIAPIA